jgi:formamidopyrimidine-DNA glycosylase
MPELPEVEIMSENLRGWIDHQRIRNVEVVDDLLLQEGDPEALRGQTVRAVRRVAKYTLVETRVAVLILHYRMTGKVVLEPTEGRVRARIVTEAGPTVAFKDSRRLGEAWVVEPASVGPFFEARAIGPEPWPDPRPAAWWRERFHGLRGPIKPALLRQDRVSGLGNIAASEILWRAKIDPRRSVQALTPAEWVRIADETPRFLHETIEAERAPEVILVEEGGEGPFAVYDEEGNPCPRCGATLERFVQAARSTYFCPKCQKPPRTRKRRS